MDLGAYSGHNTLDFTFVQIITEFLNVLLMFLRNLHYMLTSHLCLQRAASAYTSWFLIFTCQSLNGNWRSFTVDIIGGG
jgi:hypothetical protein